MSRKSDWNQAADIAIAHINKKADTDGVVVDIWEVFADQMSKRKWANEHFNALIDDIVDNLDALEDEFFREGDRFDDWFEDAVIAMVNGNFSVACLNDRDISDDLSNDIFRKMQKDAEFYKDMIGSRRGRGRDDRGRDRDRGAGGGRVRGERSGGGALPERSRGGERVRGGEGGRTRDSDEPGRWGSLADDTSSKPDREKSERYADERPEAEYEREERQPRERQAAAPAPEPERAPERTVVKVEGPNHTRSRPYDEFWMDGCHYQAAHLSDWKVTPTSKDPLQNILDTMPNFVDVNCYIPYLVKSPEGVVTEELLKLNADNEYLQEELQVDPDRAETSRKTLTAGINLRAAARGETPVTGQAGDGMASPTTPTAMSDLLKQVDISEAKLNNAPIVDNLTSAIFTSRSRLVSSDNLKPRVDFHVIRTPVLVTEDAQHELVDEIFTTNNLSDASAKLLELKPKFDPGLWAVLNDRYSAALLRTLRFQFQFPDVKALSFATDYPRLLAAFAKRRGEAESAQFASRVRFINSLVCQNVGRDNAEYLEDLVDNPANVHGVVFTEYAAVVAVNHTLDALGVGEILTNPRKDGVGVQASKNKELFDVVANIYVEMDRQVPSPAKVRVYIATSDNYRIEILPFAGRNEAFILALA